MKSLIVLIHFLLSLALHVCGQDVWTKKADFAGPLRVFKATGFGILDKGYIGTANQGTLAYSDLWEYNIASNSWSEKASFNSHSSSAVSFSIGNKGYIGTGFYLNSYRNDFWEFDAVSNTWTQVANFAGGSRASAIGFSIANKGYIGTGFDGAELKKDFWEYDPSANAWTQKSDFGAGLRQLAVGFCIGSKGYVGTGTSDVAEEKDFWEYNPSNDVWTRKSDFPGGTRQSAIGFNINNKGYVGLGAGAGISWSDLWEYNPKNDKWIKKSNFPGGTRLWATAFSVGNKGYVGTGVLNGQVQSDFWEYNPNEVVICNQTWMQSNLTVTHYRNGDPIPEVSDPGQWNALTTGAWCYYNNDPSTEATYGKLYNWYAVNDPRGLAPEGWRIPDNGDWITLENCAGGYFTAGGALKEPGTLHWLSPNTGATNYSGFTALPGGHRSGGGSFSELGTVGNWWSSNSGSYYHYGILFEGGFYRSLFTGSAIFFGNPSYSGYPTMPIFDYKSGLSVRCIRNCLPEFLTCSSDITVMTEPGKCAMPVTYTATFSGPPSTKIEYIFSGATAGAGNGTGSGQLFNTGITSVVITASNECGIDSCQFNITVIDSTPPLIECVPPQSFCYNSSASYTIPSLLVKEVCGIKEISYNVRGATIRTGVGSNASGLFNQGRSTIDWKVTDSAGNSSLCQTVVTINPKLSATIPNSYSALLGRPNTIYLGYGLNFALLTVQSAGGSAFAGNTYRYKWSTGATNSFIIVSPSTPGEYSYSVTVTDAAGCQIVAEKKITVMDVRCGPRNNKVLVCEPNNRQRCINPFEVPFAVLFNNAEIGACRNLLTQTRDSKRPIQYSKEPPAFEVLPNPNNGSFSIQLNNLFASEIRIINQSGRILVVKKIDESINSQRIDMTLGYAPKGIYYVQVIGRKGVFTSKMIVQ